MVDITLERLKETDIAKYPSNSLIDYYDSIHKLLDAIACIDGVKFRGDGAHQQLINHAHLEESERVFLQTMREFRNRIQYDGFIVNREYISSNSERIEKIIERLISTVKSKL